MIKTYSQIDRGCIMETYEDYHAGSKPINGGKRHRMLKKDASQPKYCWHHANVNRLRTHLRGNVCDIYPRGRLIGWLRPGDRVQFAVNGQIIAEATVVNNQPRTRTPTDPPVGNIDFPLLIDLRDIAFVSPRPCTFYKINPRFGSHRLH